MSGTSSFLLSCSSGHMKHTLKRFDCCEFLAEDDTELSSLTPALAAFKGLKRIDLGTVELSENGGTLLALKDFAALSRLPALTHLFVCDADPDFFSALPLLGALRCLKVQSHTNGCPPLVSSSLESLSFGQLFDFSSLAALLGSGVRVPRLGSITVETLESQEFEFEMSAEDVREEATTLAVRCACLPGTAVIFENVHVQNPIDLDMVVEVCIQLPRLGWGVQSLDLPFCQDIPLGKLHHLWRLCPNITGKLVQSSFILPVA